MRIQTLITTMNLDNPYKLVHKMNVQTDFLIGNQTSVFEDITIKDNGNTGIIYSRAEVGVGRNRNNLLSHSDADICVLADDDMRFIDGYESIVKKVFEENQDLDVAVLNLNNSDKRKNTKSFKLNITNYENYGAARLVFRRKSIVYNNIFFNINFGGGTQHQCGEDSLFLRECLAKRLTVKTIPVSIAELLDDRQSTWFEGYTERYLYDKGVFLGLAHPILSKPFALYLVSKHPEYAQNRNMINSYRIICEGINYIAKKEYRSNDKA